MNDVGGSSGTGLRASGKTGRTSDANFEYDDSEWDVGIGNLIIDLDLDIEKNNEASRNSLSNSNSPVPSSSSTAGPSLTSPNSSALPSPMHIPPTSGSPNSNNNNNNSSKSSSNSSSKTGKQSSSAFSSTTTSTKTGTTVVSSLGGDLSSSSSSSMEHSHSAVVDKGLKVKIKRTKTGTKSGAGAEHEIVKSDSSSSSSSGNGNNASHKGSETGKGGNSNSSSHKEKEGKIKDGSSMIMIDADSIVGGMSNHGASSSTSTNNGMNKDEHGKKTSRKGNKEGSHNNKKVNKNNSSNGSSTPSTKNKDSSSSSSSSDGKNNLIPIPPTTSTTVSLNVPTIVPSSNSSSSSASAFSGKTTLKVPSTNSISSSSTAQNNMQIYSSSIDARNHNNHNLSNASASSAWASPNKGGDKNANSSSLSAGDKSQQNSGSPSSFGKSKVRPTGMGAAGDKDKGIKEDGVTGTASPYRNSSENYSISATVNHPGPSVKGNKPSVPTQDVCVGTSVGTVTEPDCLGPCEPGTSVTLEGIVWHENENGILVVNVTWRGKTYVGTLIDCTKNDWAPPRFCDSPTSDLEMRTTKNRAKRGRGQAATPVNEIQAGGSVKLRNGAKGRRGSAPNAFVAPASPLKGEQWPKRKTRGSENEGQDEGGGGGGPKSAKRLKGSKDKDRQSNSPDLDKGPSSPVLIECPEPNCSKKYKHINGLRYHQSHAHNNFVAEDSDSNASTTSTQLPTPTEALGDRPGSEPMAVDNISDLDGDSSLVSAPNGKLEEMETQEENKMDMDVGEGVDELPLSLSAKSGKSGKVTNKESDNIDSNSKSQSNSDSTTSGSSASVLPRTAILTVPVVPFTSLQNRHAASIPRADDSTVMKPTPINLQGKVATWPPGNNSPSASSVGDRSPRDKSSSSSEPHGKKNKHKKKSKEKDKDGKSKSDSKSDHKGKDASGGGEKNKFSTSSSDLQVDARNSSLSADDLRVGNKRDHEVNPVKESGREEPQSPAYSDISDANDSADAEITAAGLNKDGKVPGNTEIKKEGAAGIPVTPYFSSFYSHYLDPKLSGDKGPVPVGLSAEEIESKLRASKGGPPPPPPTSHPPPPPPPDDPGLGRQPKSEFGYLPPRQPMFHYPYSNYHFEQGQFNNMGIQERGSAFASEEREKEKEFVGDLSKIKQEPGSILHKDGRPTNLSKPDDKLGSEKGGAESPKPVSLSGHYGQQCSKHSKDAKRDERRDKSKDDLEKDSKMKDEGSKPTMETQGPPPPPTAGSYAYLPQPYLQPGSPFALPFDPGHPLYRQVLVPGPYGGPPYMPGSIPRYGPPTPGPPGSSIPEDLSRPPNSGPPPGPPGGAPKALDLLQHHAQFYQVHKIHELSERALKSPSPQVGAGQRERDGPSSVGAPGSSNTPTSPAGQPHSRHSTTPTTSSNNSNASKPADLSKELKPGMMGNENSRSPPTQHHVHSHTHHHTHVGIGYPILPGFPAPHSPHYGVLPTPPPATPVISPFPSQKPN